MKVTGEGQMSKKIELMVISRKLLHSQTSYMVPRYNTIYVNNKYATSNDLSYLDIEA